jgi:hypothetical protein
MESEKASEHERFLQNLQETEYRLQTAKAHNHHLHEQLQLQEVEYETKV